MPRVGHAIRGGVRSKEPSKGDEPTASLREGDWGAQSDASALSKLVRALCRGKGKNRTASEAESEGWIARASFGLLLSHYKWRSTGYYSGSEGEADEAYVVDRCAVEGSFKQNRPSHRADFNSTKIAFNPIPCFFLCFCVFVFSSRFCSFVILFLIGFYEFEYVFIFYLVLLCVFWFQVG